MSFSFLLILLTFPKFSYLTRFTNAAKNGDLQTVRSLVWRTDINERDETPYSQNKNTALIWASINGHYWTAKELLEAKADVHLVNGDDQTALDLAVSRGNAAIVDLLIKAKSDVNRVQLNSRATPIIYPAIEVRTDVIKLLINAKANLNHEYGAGQTALSWAACKNHFDALKMLIDANANINHVDNDGCTALMIVSRMAHVTENVFHLLIKSKTDIEKQSNGKTALMLAVDNNHVAVDLLVLYGADTSQVSENVVVQSAIRKKLKSEFDSFLLCSDFVKGLPDDANSHIIDVVVSTIESIVPDFSFLRDLEDSI